MLKVGERKQLLCISTGNQRGQSLTAEGAEAHAKRAAFAEQFGQGLQHDASHRQQHNRRYQEYERCQRKIECGIAGIDGTGRAVRALEAPKCQRTEKQGKHRKEQCEHHQESVSAFHSHFGQLSIIMM